MNQETDPTAVSRQAIDDAAETVDEGDSGAKRRRVVIVGAGQTGRQLAQVLSENWDIAVLDPDETKLERIREENPSRTFKLFPKDGTSVLNLRDAGLEGAEWLIAATDFDEANIEACRLALSASEPPTALGIVRRPESVAELKSTGAEILLRPGAVAGLVKNRIERAYQVASGVGIGQNEIIEIPVLRSSPAVDAQVRDLRARRWLVAAIYRDDHYVVPHGHVVIRQGDRLLLTGEPDILPHIADFLRAGVARFPLQFGVRAVAYARTQPPEGYWNEIEYFFNATRARSMAAFTPETEPPPELDLARGRLQLKTIDDFGSLEHIVDNEVPELDCGCLIIPKPEPSFFERIGLKMPEFADALDRLDCPLLMANGTHPFRRILLPVLDADASLLAAELAIDLSRQLGVEIAAVMVTPPTFVVGQETVAEQRETLNVVMELGSLYDVKIQKIEKEGNPPQVIAGLAGKGDLLAIGHRIQKRSSFFNPDAALQIMLRCPSSVLALSYRERIHGNR